MGSGESKPQKIDRWAAFKVYGVTEDEHLLDRDKLIECLEGSDSYRKAKKQTPKNAGKSKHYTKKDGGEEEEEEAVENTDMEYDRVAGFYATPGMEQNDVRILNMVNKVVNRATTKAREGENVTDFSAQDTMNWFIQEVFKEAEGSEALKGLEVSCLSSSVVQKDIYIKGYAPDSILNAVFGLAGTLLPLGYVAAVSNALIIVNSLIQAIDVATEEEDFKASTSEMISGFGIRKQGDSALVLRTCMYNVSSYTHETNRGFWFWSFRDKEARFKVRAAHFSFMVTPKMSSDDARGHLLSKGSLSKERNATFATALETYQQQYETYVKAYQKRVDSADTAYDKALESLKKRCPPEALATHVSKLMDNAAYTPPYNPPEEPVIELDEERPRKEARTA